MNKLNPLWVSVKKSNRLFSYIKKGESLFEDPFLGNFVPADYWNSMLPPLSTFQLIPRYLISASHCIQKIKNEFAHRVALEHLEELHVGLIESLRNVVQEVVNDSKVQGNQESFEFLTNLTSMGLLAYRQNLQFLRMDIESPNT